VNAVIQGCSPLQNFRKINNAFTFHCLEIAICIKKKIIIALLTIIIKILKKKKKVFEKTNQLIFVYIASVSIRVYVTELLLNGWTDFDKIFCV